MSYTTAAKVRAMLPTLLINDDDLGVSQTGTNLVLMHPAFDVPTILIDGVSSTAFTFERPDKITLDASATGERFIAQTYSGISDVDIDNLIAMSDRFITSEFSQFDLPSGGYLEDWSSILTAARYLRLYGSATDNNIDKVKGLEKLVMDEMESYKDNTSSDKSYLVLKVNP